MKTTIKLICGILLSGLLLAATGAHAQAPVTKVTLENEKVKVISAEFKPGDITPTHSHPDHVVYVISGGKMEITEQGKQAQTFDFKEGDTMWMPAVTHTVKNIGSTEVKIVVVELKQATATK